jgi:hypothetical protein
MNNPNYYHAASAFPIPLWIYVAKNCNFLSGYDLGQ